MLGQRGHAALIVACRDAAGRELRGAALEGALVGQVGRARPDGVEALCFLVAGVGGGQSSEREAQDGGLGEDHGGG